MPLRLIIADDHPLLINGLVAVLSEMEDLELQPAVNDGRQLLASLQRAPADLVLLDLNMPHLDGIKTLEILHKNYPELKVIVLSNYSQQQLIEEVKSKGAHGYLLKNSSTTRLKEAIAKVAAGELYFEEAPAAAEVDSYFLDDFLKKYNLTKREVEIIQMVGKELTSKQIGDTLSISEFTVNTHRRNIMRKLDINNLVGLINFAQKNGLAIA